MNWVKDRERERAKRELRRIRVRLCSCLSVCVCVSECVFSRQKQDPSVMFLSSSCRWIIERNTRVHCDCILLQRKFLNLFFFSNIFTLIFIFINKIQKKKSVCVVFAYSFQLNVGKFLICAEIPLMKKKNLHFKYLYRIEIRELFQTKKITQTFLWMCENFVHFKWVCDRQKFL